MKDELIKAIKEALENGKASAAVVLTEKDGLLVPRIVTKPDDPTLDSIYIGDSRYPMASFAMMILPLIEGNLALPVRECDRRMLFELQKHNQIELDRLVLLGIPCSQELADTCGCDHPFTENGISVAPAEAKPAQPSPPPEAVAEDPEERLAFWMDAFSRCIKCMGCRNVCPMCFCNDCALDNLDYVSADSKPPDIPIFHLIRAVDMADRCVDCGMCEAICPAEIPLRQLYRQVRDIVKEAYGYEAGVSEEKSPIEMLGEPEELAGMQEGFRQE
jgi:formate dehydrogenase (coenzyme F420) beta subunit